MNFVKKAILSVVLGGVITGIGIGLMVLGSVGPCGPGDGVGAIGYWIAMEPIFWLLSPQAEVFFGRLHADFLFFPGFPALFWSLVMFVVLSVWSKLRQMLNKQSSDIPTPSPPPESLPPTSSG